MSRRPVLVGTYARGTGLLGPVVLAAVLAGGAGCQVDRSARLDFSETPREYVARDYGPVYQRWTRHDFALHDADKALEVWATFKSWDFREAYIERYSSIYNLPDSERDALREAQRGAVHQAYEFHVTAQSTEYKWNDLEKSNSAWRVTLLDALAHELQPEYVRIEKLPDAYEREFFPSKTPFTKSYAIRFAIPADGSFTGVKSGAITLRFASPVGQVDLQWKS